MDDRPQTILPAIPPEMGDMAFEVMDAACKRGLTVVAAESCTGGLLAALLTDIEGCSHAFERGFVCYTDEAKAELLCVDPDVLATQGAVSAQAAAQMAAGALGASRGDIAISITGYADPPADDDAPGGLVYIGLADRTGELRCRSTISAPSVAVPCASPAWTRGCACCGTGLSGILLPYEGVSDAARQDRQANARFAGGAPPLDAGFV